MKVVVAGAVGPRWTRRSAVPPLLLVALAGCASGPNAPGTAIFHLPLPVPPLVEGRVDAEGRRVFDLEARDGVREFTTGVETETRGINGGHLGPTLRARRGERVRVRLTNHLDEVTTLHWHGMELPPSMDGGPHQMVAPGETWSPEWTVDQPAATLWYHPHPHGATERQVYSGMAGFFLLDDAASDELALPSEYGIDDLPLLIQDVRLDSEGSLVRHAPWYNQVGPLGDIILVNGALTPHVDVHRERTRLRFLNASSSRVFNLGFTDGRSFAVIGTDGGLLPAPHTAKRVQLSPGERAEIVVELSQGDTTVLRSFEQTLGTDFLNHRWAGGNDRFDLLKLRAGPDLEPSPELPARLIHLPEPDLSAVDTTRSFRVSSRTINGLSMDMNRIDARVRPGSVEIWEVEGIAVPHNLHLHGVQFRILDVDGTPPDPLLDGRKDTVYLMPDQVTRILIEFPDTGDDPTPFMFHCHFLRHEDDGAMGQFQVTRDGERARAADTLNPHP
jgi:FtsP/CotA-like multicopper oxidase with cupredoxin domain